MDIKKNVFLNKLILISTYDKFLLFIYPLVYFFNNLCGFWPKYKKMTLLFKKGLNKIENEFDIVKIIKMLRNLSILLEYE